MIKKSNKIPLMSKAKNLNKQLTKQLDLKYLNGVICGICYVYFSSQDCGRMFKTGIQNNFLNP